MGRQRRLKQQRRNNERAKAEFGIFPTIEFMLNEEFMLKEDMDLDQPENFTEVDVILKRLMPMLSSFSGKNFELWAIKMEGLLGSVDLWKFVQDTDMNSENKSRRAITLFLIISALDENIMSNILNEFGEVFDPKVFWHILEIKYSMKWSQKGIIDETVIKNSDCVESIITGIKSESMAVDDNKVACDNQEIPCDAKICEVKYDENYVSHEEWLCLMHEKQLIDEKICLSSSTNQTQDDMFVTTEMIKEVKIMNQPIMKDEDLQNDVDITESKIVEDSIASHEVVKNSIAALDEVVEDSIIVDEVKKFKSPFEEECENFDTEEKELEEMASIEDKCKSRKSPAMLNGKNVSLQSRKEKLHHYLMAKKVKMKKKKFLLQINKYRPFRKKTKMKVLLSYIVVSLAET